VSRGCGTTDREWWGRGGLQRELDRAFRRDGFSAPGYAPAHNSIPRSGIRLHYHASALRDQTSAAYPNSYGLQQAKCVRPGLGIFGNAGILRTVRGVLQRRIGANCQGVADSLADALSRHVERSGDLQNAISGVISQQDASAAPPARKLSGSPIGAPVGEFLPRMSCAFAAWIFPPHLECSLAQIHGSMFLLRRYTTNSRELNKDRRPVLQKRTT
jgi:hypothetical protein